MCFRRFHNSHFLVASEDGDGLHLSGAGQRFVAEKLLALLPTLGLDRDALAYDAPWGFEVDANEPASSLRAHFARHRGALQANSGVPGLDREESRPLPGARRPRQPVRAARGRWWPRCPRRCDIAALPDISRAWPKHVLVSGLPEAS